MKPVDMTSMLAQLQAMKAQAGGGLENTQKPGEPGSFAELLKASINTVNDTQKQAGALSAAFEQGDPNVDLAEVMVALQKAGMSFQTMLQVRNRLVEAYQDVKNMPM